MKDISVRYLGGSGFLVSVGDTALLFDASEHGNDARALPEKEELAAFRRLFVFASHHHEDHFSPAVYDLAGDSAIYILGSDIGQPHKGIRMSAGEEKSFGSVTVQAFGSTDEGVSFLVRVAGVVFFHAGDLNLWHWRDENTVAQIQAAETAFYDCVAPIPASAIDVAFFPVDPRQGSMYDAGVGYFMMEKKPRVLIPMHFQGRADVAVRFAATAQTSATRVLALREAGDRVQLHIPETEESAPDQKLRELLENPDF